MAALDTLVVLGGGEHAQVVIDTAQMQGWQVLGFVDPQPRNDTAQRSGVPWLGPDTALAELLTQHPALHVTFGIGSQPALRERLAATLPVPATAWAAIIHPTASVSVAAHLGRGAQVFARAVVQAGAQLGDHVIVSSAAVVERNAGLGDFTHIAPSAVVGGDVQLGPRTLVGLGARLRDHVRVGADCIISTGAVVVADLPAGLTVAGIPAVAVRPPTELDLAGACVGPQATLHEAMTTMATCGLTIVLVTNPERKLLGTLADEDIRRALLAGQSLEQPVTHVMQVQFIAAHEDVPRATALALMQAHRIAYLPVLDELGRVRHLHALSGLVGPQELPLTAVIMAGGKGTRLLPLTELVPKPMVRVAGRPILEHLVLHLAAAGIHDIYLAVNHLSHVIENYFGAGAQHACRLHYLRERQPLGSGGALSLLPPTVPAGHALLVLNGDLMTQFNVERLHLAHRNGQHRLTIGVRDYQVTVPYGVVVTDGERVTQLQEKPTQHYTINAGVYIVAADLLARIPRDQEYPMTALVEACLTAGERVGLCLLDGDWLDVGRHDDLARARGQTT